MKKLFFLLLLCCSFAHANGEKVLIGGGKRAPSILKKMIELTGDKPIVLVPLASEIPDEIVGAIKNEFSLLGFLNVEGYKCKAENVDDESCLAQLKNAGLIFFTGGDQNRLLKALQNSKAFSIIQDLHSSGVHLAGTSAGTAIMSEVMLTGSPLAPYTEFDGIRPKMVETTKGFGFVKKIIIDQHFLKRGRENRLMSAVLDRPHLVGVGIDEATSIVIHSDESFDVLGESAVMVIDARKSQININNDHYQTRNLKVDLLSSGEGFSFNNQLN
jgi:cyanophycinase